jgi:hypothetical protein
VARLEAAKPGRGVGGKTFKRRRRPDGKASAAGCSTGTESASGRGRLTAASDTASAVALAVASLASVADASVADARAFASVALSRKTSRAKQTPPTRPTHVRRHRGTRNVRRATTSARRISFQVGNETARLRARAVCVAGASKCRETLPPF